MMSLLNFRGGCGKCISLGRLGKYQPVFVRQKSPSNQLSTRTSRASGQKLC